MTESPFNGSPLAALPPEVVTLIPYPDARRLKVAAIAASDTDVTVLIPDPGNAEAIEAVEKMTSLSVTPIETSTSSIDGVLDRLSGSIDDSELWLQRRHIQALGRLVDHSVNLGKTERVRPLVDRALEFAPYSAELWLMEARLASQRRDVIHALRIASQIAPDDRRILRWIQSFDEVSFADESAQTAAESGADSESPAQAVDEDLEVAPHADEDEEPGNSGATLEQAFVAEVGAPTIELPLETPAAEPTAGEDGSPEETERPSTFETTASGEMVGEAAAEAIAEAVPVAEAERPESAARHEALPQSPTAALDTPGALEAPQSETLALAVALARIRSMPELVERLSTEIQRLTGAQSASTFFRFHNTWSGFSTDDRLRRQLVKSLPKENRLAAQVLKLGVPVVITDTSLRQEDAGPMVIEAGIRSFALLPIRTDGEVGGLLYLNYEEPDQANMVFESERGRTIELMLTCAGVSASAINQKTVLEDASALDPLTGAYSLRQLEQLLETEINRGRRYRYSVALLSFDIDNFAEVNDKFGQAAGDGVLQYVAKRVLEMGRGSDILARRGSDDFMLMLPQTTGKGAESMARRIHQAFENPVTAGDYRVRITLSIGMASFPERADDAAELLNAAEIALYSAKAQGKNRTSVADTLSLGS